MSSFKRKTDAVSQKLPPGLRSSPSSSKILLTSSGVSSLDDVLGGGIQLGTSFLLLGPDPHSAHCELLHKYFIAQGLASAQNVLVFDPFGKDLVESCMWVAGDTGFLPDDEELEDAQEKVKIAWRYERLQKFKTTVSSKSSDQDGYCRPFDLLTRLPECILTTCKDGGLVQVIDCVFDSKTDVYEAVIHKLEEFFQNQDSSRQDTVRLSFPSLGSPYWRDTSPEKIIEFLLRLRQLLYSQPVACALISLPSHLCDDNWGGDGWTEKLSWATDASITLNSYSADPSSGLLIPNHHGLVRISRLPCVNSLVPASDRHSTLRGLAASASAAGGVSENNLAFKCTRKRFIIETFHLDVEGGVGERRTAPSAASVALQESFESSQHQHASLVTPEKSSATVSVEVEVTTPQEREENGLPPEKAPAKKPKKRVGFQVDQPNLYDF